MRLKACPILAACLFAGASLANGAPAPSAAPAASSGARAAKKAVLPFLEDDYAAALAAAKARGLPIFVEAWAPW